MVMSAQGRTPAGGAASLPKATMMATVGVNCKSATTAGRFKGCSRLNNVHVAATFAPCSVLGLCRDMGSVLNCQQALLR
jgi:hypothetical protein